MAKYQFKDILGKAVSLKVISLAQRFAVCQENILLIGEQYRQVIAQAIHVFTDQRDRSWQ